MVIYISETSFIIFQDPETNMYKTIIGKQSISLWLSFGITQSNAILFIQKTLLISNQSVNIEHLVGCCMVRMIQAGFC